MMQVEGTAGRTLREEIDHELQGQSSAPARHAQHDPVRACDARRRQPAVGGEVGGREKLSRNG